MAKITVSTGISTTQKSAQSKKCRMLQKVANKQLHPKIAEAWLKLDPMLGAECTIEEIAAAVTGTRPGRGSKGTVSIEIEIEE